MGIRSSLDGLRSVFGVDQTAPVAAPVKSRPATRTSSMGTDEATVSSTGSAVSLSMTGSSVRTDKVASIQAALGAGTYNVSASAVASSVVGFMLSGAR